MTVTNKSFYHVERLGQTHYFCGAKCKARFTAHGLRPTGGDAGDAPLPANPPAQRKLVWFFSLALLATLLIASRWFHSQ
jgi:hypothetical protein